MYFQIISKSKGVSLCFLLVVIVSENFTGAEVVEDLSVKDVFLELMQPARQHNPL